ncbi:uncharacterized protein CEXT_667091, partial [Caerostris extrusa]
ASFNLALINHDLDFLTDQNTEMKQVLHRINLLKDQSWSGDIRTKLQQLNSTLTTKSNSLTTGLDKYHKLSADERSKLRELYGAKKAPMYYTRLLNSIIKK